MNPKIKQQLILKALWQTVRIPLAVLAFIAVFIAAGSIFGFAGLFILLLTLVVTVIFCMLGYILKIEFTDNYGKLKSKYLEDEKKIMDILKR